MSTLLSSPLEITLMLLGLSALGIISWWRFNWGVSVVVLSLPLYLLKVKIDWLPTNVLELMILVIFLVFCLRQARRRRGLFGAFGGFRKFQGLIAASLLILIGVIISALNSVNLEVSAGILKGWFLTPMIFALVVADTIKSKKQLKNFLATFVICGTSIAIVALWYFFCGWLSYDGRLKAFYLSPNHLAMYLAPIIIITFGLFSNYSKNGRRYPFWFLAGGLVLMSVCLYLTYSYGAWLGIIVALLVMATLSRKKLHQKQFSVQAAPRTVFLILVFVILILVFSQLGTEKFHNLLYFTRSSLQSRLMVWRTALALIKDYPILGIGPGMFQKFYLAYQVKFPEPYLEWAVPQPHNLFLAFWLQTGLLGLVGFLWLLVDFFKKTLKSRANEPLMNILIAVMSYIIIHGLVDTTYWKNDLAIIFWLVIGLSVALFRLSRNTIMRPENRN